MTNNSSMDSEYIIPSIRTHTQKLWFILPIALILLTCAGFIFGGRNPFHFIFIFGILFTVFFSVLGQLFAWMFHRSVRNKHSYTWYREQFPSNAHSNGHVSCRHCGGHKLNVRNLMNKSYMRAHTCSQCGETLYFTPESR